MNREIEFKAKRKDNGKWVCGLLAPIFSFKDGIVFKICEVYKDSEGNLTGFEVFEVEQETISQFTGLKDKNGKEIYEGDIFSPRDRDVLFVVIWDNDTASFKFKSRYGVYEIDKSILSLEIVDNIHDNPELLEGKE